MRSQPHFFHRWFCLPNSIFYLAALYLLLTFFAITCFPPLAAQDFLAPLLALYLLCHCRQVRPILAESSFFLPAFLLLALTSSLYHASRGSGGFYDLAVFAYMALLYLFFRLLPSGKSLFWQGLGLSMLLVLLGTFAIGAMALLFPVLPGKGLFYFDPYSGSRGLNLLTLRYQFLFNNPNLLGSFYILPLALAQPWLLQKMRNCRSPRQVLLLFASIGLCLLPLISTASKHALMSLAILGGTMLEAWPNKGKRLQIPVVCAIILFAAVCLLTVLWPIFPISGKFPYLNFQHQGNYTIHQEIYLKMLSSDKCGWLAGLGSKSIRQCYPQFADREKIASIMERYHSPHWVEPFCTYMDPHQEYLNLASLFGIPAMLCCFAFWLWHLQGKRPAMLLFIPAVLICCLWDDLLSKRWLWITLAIMGTRTIPKTEGNSQHWQANP
jgi:hypothetical protein